MSWPISEDELHRARAMDADARSTSRGSSIPIWPHERFTREEAVGSWADAEPARISLEHDWLTDARAAWFAENELHVAVFMVGTSSMAVDYSVLAENLRGEERARYLRGRRSGGVARQPKRVTRVTKDLVAYINQREIDLVIERVPEEYRTRLRDVFRYHCADAKILGSVSTRGRRDIDLTAALPIRVSLGRYLHGGQSPAEFGAPARGQWPPWAVRRFLLYDVLFHEIGHLQIIEPKASRVQRKFASETRAQEFADELRRTLYSEPFDHVDPIHNTPTPGELAMLTVWEHLDKDQRAALVKATLWPRRQDCAELSVCEPMTPEQRAFLSRVLAARAETRSIRES